MSQSNLAPHNLPSLEKMVRALMKSIKATDRQRQSLQVETKEIEEYYNPRREFNRWSQSQAGREWKQQKWEKQNKCCAICSKPVDFYASHIDHIKPIASYPELNLNLKNLRITHPHCNLSREKSCL